LDEAIQQFEKTISLRPNEPLLYNNLGMSLLRHGESSQAARAFQEALEVGEPHPKIYNNLALALCKLGKYPEALEAFKRSGDEASAYYHLGCIYLADNKYREAIEAFDRTIELTPGFHLKAYEKKQQAKAALSVLF
jgi:tetratricopeptide (TPR) repeat protein